jgi:membrane protease YdiL (CAAX protease family)
MIQGYRMAGPPPHGEPPQAPERSEPQWPMWAGFVALLAAVFVSSVAAAFLYGAFAPDVDNAPAWVDMTAQVLVEFAFVGSALVAAALVKPLHAWQFGLRPTRVARALGWSAAGMVAFYVFAALWVALVGQLHQSTAEDVGADQGRGALIAAGFAFVIIAPICEELFFRGFFYGSLRNRLSTPWAAGICGLVFGGIHFTTGVSAVPVLIVFGIVLCLVRETTGSLYPCIAMHAFNNTIAYAGQTDVAPGVAAAFGVAMLLAVVLVPRFAWRRQPSPA